MTALHGALLFAIMALAGFDLGMGLMRSNSHRTVTMTQDVALPSCPDDYNGARNSWYVESANSDSATMACSYIESEDDSE